MIKKCAFLIALFLGISALAGCRSTPAVYAITYLDIGGETFSGVHGQNQPTSHTYGQQTTLVNPTKRAHQFLGWFLSIDGSGYAKTYLGANEFTDDITLHAKWQEVDIVDVLFNPQGGTPVAPQEVIIGTQAIEPIAPTRDGHRFNGWLLNGVYFDFSTELSDNITLMASWVSLIDGFIYVSVGTTHNIAIDSIGQLWSWGLNAEGRTAQDIWLAITFYPMAINTGTTRFNHVSAGFNHNIAVDREGNLWSWGNNADGRTGLGISENYTSIPELIDTGDNRFVFVSTRESHNIAIDTKGNLWSWGNNINGRTGLGLDEGATLVPTQIDTDGARFVQVSAGNMHSTALDTEGRIWSWGNNVNGRLGNGTQTGNILIPTLIDTGIIRFTYIASAFDHNVAIDGFGRLWSFGSNIYGQTGLGTDSGNTLNPTLINTGDTRFIRIAVSRGLSHVIDANGNMWSFGSNLFASTGLGTEEGETIVPEMIELDNIRFIYISASTHSIAIDSQGRFWSWGNNNAGATGLGELEYSTLVPTLIR